jgi:hypothetical protein
MRTIGRGITGVSPCLFTGVTIDSHEIAVVDRRVTVQITSYVTNTVPLISFPVSVVVMSQTLNSLVQFEFFGDLFDRQLPFRVVDFTGQGLSRTSQSPGRMMGRSGELSSPFDEMDWSNLSSTLHMK